MTTLKALFTSAVALIVTAGVIGCAQEVATDTDQKNGANAAREDDGAADPEIEKALAQLSPEDRSLAKAQKVCPVTGEPLGSMGTPEKITVEGRELFICCAGCEDMIRENPEQYLSKLDKKQQR